MSPRDGCQTMFGLHATILLIPFQLVKVNVMKSWDKHVAYCFTVVCSMHITCYCIVGNIHLIFYLNVQSFRCRSLLVILPVHKQSVMLLFIGDCYLFSYYFHLLS